MKRIPKLRGTSALLFIALTFALSMQSFAALNAYLTIDNGKGKKVKAEIKGDGTFKTPPLKAGTYKVEWYVEGRAAASSNSGSEKRVNKVEAIVIKQEIVSPRDAASGLPTGKRMHKPMTITMQLDKTSSHVCSTVGTFTLDQDCDGISGTVEAKDKMGNKTAMDSWDK